ncbi:MAG: host attachment protein [Hyphomonadaceae bacterium]|nr:host attachment protein [Hyphomonadaceae bacterium]
MLEPGVLWLVLADGRRARVLVEGKRGDALREEFAMELGPEDAYDPQDRPARSFDRVGPGRHAMDKGRDLHEQEEEKFLKRLAARLNDAAKHKQFAHLAIAAPPRALGSLRTLLSDAARAAIRGDVSKDVLSEDEASLRTRLKEMLR